MNHNLDPCKKPQRFKISNQLFSSDFFHSIDSLKLSLGKFTLVWISHR